MSILACRKNTEQVFTFQLEGYFRSLSIALQVATKSGLPFLSDAVSHNVGVTISEFSIKKVAANNDYAKRDENNKLIVESTTVLNSNLLNFFVQNGKIQYYYKANTTLSIDEGIYYFYFIDSLGNEFRTEIFRVGEEKLEVQKAFSDGFSYGFS